MNPIQQYIWIDLVLDIWTKEKCINSFFSYNWEMIKIIAHKLLFFQILFRIFNSINLNSFSFVVVTWWYYSSKECQYVSQWWPERNRVWCQWVWQCHQMQRPLLNNLSSFHNKRVQCQLTIKMAKPIMCNWIRLEHFKCETTTTTTQ